jgi:hypothetical protein
MQRKSKPLSNAGASTVVPLSMSSDEPSRTRRSSAPVVLTKKGLAPPSSTTKLLSNTDAPVPLS